MDNPHSENRKKMVVVLGPTACGKTRRGVAVARHFDGEIISADSRQIYRGMDIGTGKDLSDYGDDVAFHLIDIAPAGYKYNLYEYLRDYRAARADIENRGKLPILVGGTGLYIESALKGIVLPEVPADPELRASLAGKSLEELTEILSATKILHNTTDIDTPARAIRAIEIERYYAAHPDEALGARPKTSVPEDVIIGLDIDRDKRRASISRRLQARLDEGMLDEAKRLLDSGISPDDLIYYGLEYKYLTLHLTGSIGYRQMVDELETAIHRFAKRQMTWFRGMERRGFKITWLPYDMEDSLFIETVGNLIGQMRT